MRECMDVPAIKARLKKVEGQIRGIHNMVDNDIPCDEIMVQIGAAKAALHKIGQKLLEGHLHHCVLEGIQHGDARKTINDLAKTLEHFSRMG